jgi:outer membrane protein TolC
MRIPVKTKMPAGVQASKLAGGCGACLLAAALLAGCSTYRKSPLSPAKSERAFRVRSLNDPGLAAFLRARGWPGAQAWPPAKLDIADLDGVALYYNTEIALARAQLETAQAGRITAGERPNPVASIVPEYIPNPDAGLAPWALAFSLDIPIETAGKRARRIEQAGFVAESARWALAESVWKARSQVRAALVDYLLARRQIGLLKSEAGLHESVLRILERRLELGEGSRFEINLAQNELLQSSLAATQAEGQARQAFLALCAALGIPPSALEPYELDWPGLDDVVGAGGEIAQAAHSEGLLNRLDARRALSGYAAADAALRLEVAKGRNPPYS